MLNSIIHTPGSFIRCLKIVANHCSSRHSCGARCCPRQRHSTGKIWLRCSLWIFLTSNIATGNVYSYGVCMKPYGPYRALAATVGQTLRMCYSINKLFMHSLTYAIMIVRPTEIQITRLRVRIFAHKYCASHTSENPPIGLRMHTRTARIYNIECFNMYRK